LQAPTDRCMNCSVAWDIGFITDVLPRSFVNSEYSAHRSQRLLEREKAMLPQAMVILQRQEDSNARHREIVAMEDEKALLFLRYRQGLQLISKRQEELRSKAAEMSNVVQNRHCVVQNCRGILDDEWHCSSCGGDACGNCHSVKETDHVCDDADVLTAHLIKKDTRQCPTCGARIGKMDGGCDQMWCTMCSTAFSWETGEVVSATIHNPHFYDHMRRQRQLPTRILGDVPCGGLPDISETNVFAGAAPIHHLLVHLQDAVLPQYRMFVQDNSFHNDNELMMLRLQYLKKSIDEAAWKQQLLLIERKTNMKRDLAMAIDMLLICGVDLFQRLVVEREPEMQTEFEGLRILYNDSINAILSRYGSKSRSYILDPTWKCAM
jgi:hypothetical protein